MYWLFRVGTGDEFYSSLKHNMWGIYSKDTSVKGFLKKVREGHKLYIVQEKSNGLLLAVVVFSHLRERILGDVPTNEELGWDEKYDIRLHYKCYNDLRGLNLCSEIQGPSTIRPYNEKCKVDLPRVYREIQLTAKYRVKEQERKRNYHMRTCEADRIPGLIPKCCADHFILVQKMKDRIG